MKTTLKSLREENKKTLAEIASVLGVTLQAAYRYEQAKKGFHGLFIELKADITRKPTKEQLAWIAKLNAAGYYATVCYGADAAIREIKKYFKE